VQKLVGTEPEDLDDFRIESSNGPLCEVRNEVVEGSPLPLDAGRNFSGKGHITVVAQ
jgi:hypothetical protein